MNGSRFWKVTDALEYLRSHGWLCVPHPRWMDGFMCQDLERRAALGLRQALRDQVNRDLTAAFEHWDKARVARAGEVEKSRATTGAPHAQTRPESRVWPQSSDV